MVRYFCIMQGLRGCYMPDSVSHIRVESRKALKAQLEYDAEQLRADGLFGASKVAVTAVAAAVWRNAGRKRPDWREFVIGYGETRAANDRPFGIMVSLSNRADWLAHEEECN